MWKVFNDLDLCCNTKLCLFFITLCHKGHRRDMSEMDALKVLNKLQVKSDLGTLLTMYEPPDNSYFILNDDIIPIERIFNVEPCSYCIGVS